MEQIGINTMTLSLLDHPSEVIDSVFNTFYNHLRKNYDRKANSRRYVGLVDGVNAWLLSIDYGTPSVYVEYSQRDNKFYYSFIRALVCDYELPVITKESELTNSQSKLMDELVDESLDDAIKEIKELLESRGFTEKTTKDEFNIYELASQCDEAIQKLKHKAHPVFNKMDRTFKAMLRELSKDD